MSNLKKLRLVLTLLFIFIAYSVSAQTTIKGTVKDTNGDEVIGATILEKGTKNGTTTDINGNFTLKVSGNSPLIISYVGMKPQTVSVAGKSSVSITMQEENTSLNDVVVIGYGTMKKRDLTGAISQVKQEEIRQAPVLNAMEGLQGKIAGLDITRSSGQAGAGTEILLRGNRSLNGSNSPLYVIDGVSGGDIDNLNPNDIESIEVLKDASSTAIYGSAGANGVIIVTTRAGIKGKTQVDFNAYVGINAWPSFPSTLSGNDYIDFMAEGWYQSKKYGGGGELPGERYSSEWMSYLLGPEGKNWNNIQLYNIGFQYDKDGEKILDANGNHIYDPKAAKWVNWKNEMIHTGVQQNYNISIRGGGENLKSYMSAGYQQEKGLYRKDQAQMITFRAGADYQINKMISAGFQATVTYKNKDNRSSRLSKSLTSTPLGRVYYDGTNKLTKHPLYMEKYKQLPDGSYIADGIEENNDQYINLMADDVENVYDNNSKNFRINVAPYVEIKPLKGLSFKSLLNVRYGNSRQGIWSGLDTYYKQTGSQTNKTEGNYNTSLYWSYMWQNVLTYNFQINKIHDITLTGITEYSKSNSEAGRMYNEYMNYETQKWYNLQDGKNPTISTDYTDKSTLAYAFRAHYSLLGKYLLTASVRRDGSSVLYKDKRWDTFPAVAVGWRISDEPFMEFSRNWLDNLKLRIGYGVTGNAYISPYSSLTLVESSANNLSLGGSQVYSYILAQKVANYDLTWEKSYNWNFGLDFAFLNNRIDGSIELYQTDTKDVLYNRTLPTAFGLYNAKAPYQKVSNIARIKNKGVEVTLNTRNIKTKDFSWNSTLTFATNNEQLKEINLGNNVTVDELVSLGLYLNNPTKTLYGYKKLGIWQNDEADKAICFGCRPGDVKLAYNGSQGRGLTWDPSYTYQKQEVDEITGEKYMKTYHGAYYEDNVTTGNRTYYTGNNQYSASPSTDRMILGHRTPDWSLGFQNQFYWKGFDLTIMAFMRWGQMIDGQSNCLLSVHNTTNIPACFNYWTDTNPTNAYPRVASQSTQAIQAMGYVDGSYIKVKNITLGYSLNDQLLKKIGMSRCRLYGTITNPFIFAKEHAIMKGMDPESNCSDQFPLFRTLVFGVNLSF